MPGKEVGQGLQNEASAIEDNGFVIKNLVFL